jgi:hypothetical protein
MCCEVALADWASPVAGLNLRPSHMSANEYYSWPTENVRTYPVYYPGLEPKGYWEMLESIGPKPLVEADTLSEKASADLITDLPLIAEDAHEKQAVYTSYPLSHRR